MMGFPLGPTIASTRICVNQMVMVYITLAIGSDNPSGMKKPRDGDFSLSRWGGYGTV